MDQHKSERGSVLVELTIVIGVLILLLAGFFDFTRCFGISQSVSQISRELANVAFRECTSMPTDATDGNLTLDDCLTGQVVGLLAATQQAGGPFGAGLEVRVSIYQFDGGVAELTGSASNGMRSRIDPSAPRFRQIVQNSGIATVAEVQLPINPVFGWLLPAFPEVLYEATIF